MQNYIFSPQKSHFSEAKPQTPANVPPKAEKKGKRSKALTATSRFDDYM